VRYNEERKLISVTTMDAKSNSANPPKKEALHPRLAAMIQGWRPTLKERFDAVVAKVSLELEGGRTYHAPERAFIEVANFIVNIKQSDCIATGNVAAFTRFAMIWSMPSAP
jgi:hypothetical protein